MLRPVTAPPADPPVVAPAWTPYAGAARSVALEVLIHGPISRSEIARRLELSQASLTRLSTPLLEAGLLVEGQERTDGRAGRPSRPLDVVNGSRHFVGVKLTGDEALGVVTDLRANVVGSGRRGLPSHDPAQVADVVAALVQELSGLVRPVTAVGIGIGGLVADYTSVVSAPFLQWSGVPLGPMLQARTGMPTVIENDVVALTEAEHWFGAGRECERFAVLTMGVGVGYGAVINDRIVVGPDSGVGLVGHWPLDPFGPVCPDGHRGCAQALLTIPSITSAISGALGRDLGYDQCLDLAEAGDPAARRVLDEAGHGLGRLIAAVGNLTVPQLVVLGGEGVRLARVAEQAVHAGIAEDRSPRASELALHVKDSDASDWCRGAAVIAIQTYVLGAHPSPAG
jgi:predicted NBD/HSP70 family sugar kinase